MIALSIKIAAILFAVWAIYSKDLVIITNEAIQSKFTTYLLSIPFLFAYLVFRERKMLRAVVPFGGHRPIKKPAPISEIVGIMLSLLAFLLYWQESYSPYPLELHMFSLPLFVAGLILLLFNVPTLRTLALPITFLLFLAPPPLEIVYSTGAILASYTSMAVYTILKMMRVPVLTFVFVVTSLGTYPLIVFTIFWVFLVFIARGAAWKRIIMFLAWFPSILVSNIMGITIMTLMACKFGVDAANEGLYTIGGWFLTLIGAFLFLLFASKKILKIRIFTTESKLTSCSSCDPSLEKKQNFCSGCGKLLKYINIKISKRDVLKIAALVMIAGLSMSLEVSAFALKDGKIQVITYLPREGKVDTPVLPDLAGYALSFGCSDEQIEELVGPNESLTYVYEPVIGSIPTIYGAMSVNASENVVLHGKILDSRDVQLLQNPSIMGNLVSLHKPDSNLTLVILYWYERAIFATESTIVRKHIRIAIFAFDNSSTDYTRVEENLLPVGQAVAAYLEPTRVWSDISSLFPQYLYVLSVMVIGIIVVISIIQVLNSKKEKGINLRAFNKLALEDDKNVLRAVYQAERMGNSVPNAIAVSFQNLAGKLIDQSDLLDTLKYAEELGLVKNSVANEEGEPRFVWKTRIAFPGSKLH